MSYKSFSAWKKSMELAEQIYRVTNTFPKTERYGIAGQMRRAAVSVPSNIAEGFRRGTGRERHQFLRYAFASSAELETQLILSMRIGYLECDQARSIINLLGEVMKILNATLKNANIAK